MNDLYEVDVFDGLKYCAVDVFDVVKIGVILSKLKKNLAMGLAVLLLLGEFPLIRPVACQVGRGLIPPTPGGGGRLAPSIAQPDPV